MYSWLMFQFYDCKSYMQSLIKIKLMVFFLYCKENKFEVIGIEKANPWQSSQQKTHWLFVEIHFHFQWKLSFPIFKSMWQPLNCFSWRYLHLIKWLEKLCPFVFNQLEIVKNPKENNNKNQLLAFFFTNHTLKPFLEK